MTAGSKVLMIDDVRDIKRVLQDFGFPSVSPDAAVARTFGAGIELLQHGPWDYLLLDHDLSDFDRDGRERTGYDVMCWLEQNPQFLPGKILVISSNPVGRDRINSVIRKLYENNG